MTDIDPSKRVKLTFPTNNEKEDTEVKIEVEVDFLSVKKGKTTVGLYLGGIELEISRELWNDITSGKEGVLRDEQEPKKEDI